VTAVWPFLKPQIQTIDETLFLGYFGPVGVGALFFAQIALEETGLESIWVVVSFIVFTQIVIFGLTDTMLLIWYKRRNPNYVNRRSWKVDVFASADEQKKQLDRNAQAIIRGEVAPKLPNAATESTEADDEGIPGFQALSPSEARAAANLYASEQNSGFSPMFLSTDEVEMTDLGNRNDLPIDDLEAPPSAIDLRIS